MSLETLLANHRSSIIKKWRDAIIATYPGDAQRFLKKEKDPFSNPVGHIITREVEILFDELIGGGDREKISSSLDKILRIRAVQDFKPSQAVGFVPELKRVVRERLGDRTQTNALSSELKTFEDRIDDMLLLAFDIYSQCRQKMYEIRVKEVQNQVGRLLERANLVKEIPEQEKDL